MYFAQRIGLGLQTLLHRVLLFFLYATGMGFIVILLQKEIHLSSLNELGVELAFNKYPLLDFIFDWPLIVAVSLFLVWLGVRQFCIKSVIEKLKLNGIAFLAIWFLWATWLIILYAPIGQLK